MDLFIGPQPNSTQTTSSRDLREDPAAYKPEMSSCAAEAYAAEVAYDRKRTKRRKRFRAVRMIACFLAVPVAALAVFTVSYALTYIVHGASFDEVVQALIKLFSGMETNLLSQLSETLSQLFGTIT